uniref:Uncharacterized protein n=2 Tax=Helianthus annuus TaxID=4232 RepID=A0A251V0L7_HELAN
MSKSSLNQNPSTNYLMRNKLGGSLEKEAGQTNLRRKREAWFRCEVSEAYAFYFITKYLISSIESELY